MRVRLAAHCSSWPLLAPRCSRRSCVPACCSSSLRPLLARRYACWTCQVHLCSFGCLNHHINTGKGKVASAWIYKKVKDPTTSKYTKVDNHYPPGWGCSEEATAGWDDASDEADDA